MLDLIVFLDRRLELLWLCDDRTMLFLMRPNISGIKPPGFSPAAAEVLNPIMSGYKRNMQTPASIVDAASSPVLPCSLSGIFRKQKKVLLFDMVPRHVVIGTSTLVQRIE